MATRARDRLFVAVWAIVCGVAAGQATPDGARPQAPRAAPLFTGKSLPPPPQQGKAWKLPATTLPEKCQSAVAALVKAGFADPRDCGYCEVEITTGGVWGDRGGVTKAHAWLLPHQAGDQQRFAVTWSGLVYPAIKVGQAVDLKADVAAMLQKKVNYRSHAVPEQDVVSHEIPSGLKLTALLLLGDVDSAQ